MRKLQFLLKDVRALKINGSVHVELSGLSIDSRKVKTQGAFIAIKGTSTDGHLYIDQAIQNGAVAIICESIPDNLKSEVTYVVVENAAAVAGIMASAWYDEPSRHMKVIGVTGTNGKTTTTTLLFDMFKSLGNVAGLISTVEVRIDTDVLPATHTTPDPMSLQEILSKMRQRDCTVVFMEVSSHAIDQSRIAGIVFAGGIFTNISHDHLDYHKTFANYIEAKKKFFDHLPSDAFAIVNIDDKRGEVMVQNTFARVRRFALKRIADYQAKLLDDTVMGLHLEVDDVELFTQISGEFNAYNLLAAYACAMELGIGKQEALVALSQLKGAEGRFEAIKDPVSQVTFIVDYAHTPDALEKVVATANKMKSKGARIIVVVGCGGDRDKTKRPVMGKIALQGEGLAIFTADNPRSENAEDIIEDMKANLMSGDLKRLLTIPDRKVAIQTAKQIARPNDIVIVAGKGHEKYQEINGVKHPFDDKDVIKKLIEP